MPERVEIQSPPADFGRSPEAELEHTRKIAYAVRQLIRERPTGVLVANTPAQITANQNNYAHGEVDVLRAATDASRNITGLDYQGFRYFRLLNVGSFNIVLMHQDVASEAQNRFLLSTGADITVAANGSIRLWYDEESSRWRDIV